jgi:hypothetical protein
MKYGHKYCEDFKRLEGRSSSTKLKQFVKNTRKCLQDSLKTFMRRFPNDSCARMTNYAFASHPNCYTNHNSPICMLNVADQTRVGAIVEARDLFTDRTKDQMIEVGRICAPGMLARGAAWVIPRLLRLPQ